MRSLLPFGVIGSNTTLTDDEGNKYRSREYPWGVVNIEDQVRSPCKISHYLLLTQSHCDFTPLRHLLLATHMQDLKEVTHATHYENFRRQKLGGMMEQEVGILSMALVGNHR